MSTYSQIFGGKVNVVASDPSNPINGQVWYNSTSKVVKFREVLQTGVWATGGNMTTARQGLAGCGTQTAGLCFGGIATVALTATQEYTGATNVTRTVTAS